MRKSPGGVFLCRRNRPGCGNRIRAKYATKSGVQIAGMIFQTGSGNRADYHIKRILQAGIFMEKLIPGLTKKQYEKEQNALKIIPNSLHSAETKN